VPTYETSGAWIDGELIRYCSPGPWASGLAQDSYEGGSVYVEYQPVAAVFDLAANSLTEIALSGAPLRNADLDGSHTLSALGAVDPFSGDFSPHPVRSAGYEGSDSSGHRVYLHYLRDDESTQISVSQALSSTALIATTEGVLVDPGPLIAFDGGIACVDEGSVVKFS